MDAARPESLSFDHYLDLVLLGELFLSRRYEFRGFWGLLPDLTDLNGLAFRQIRETLLFYCPY
jgi:hypothetical protein